MKTFKTTVKSLMTGLLCVAISAPLLTSCYDDSQIWDKLTNIEDRLNQLEVDLTEQAEAMSALLSDGSTITSCKKNDDGSFTITLSNGTKFKVLPEGTAFSSLVTYTVVGGKNCWATYDANGNPVVLKDASGNAIPVSPDVSVKIKDGVYYLVINGREYATGYDAEDVVQVFSSCTPLTDASGNVYAVRFTFGEGMEVTVSLDGYTGVLFKLSANNNKVVTDYFIDYATTQSFLMERTGVVDYVMQVPDGWRVKVTEEELTGETFIHITAPSEETVKLGAAVSEGDFKVVSVVEGGKAAVSKMYLSTDPFKKYDVTALKAVVEPYTGILKFAYGMMLYKDYDEAQVAANVNTMLSSNADYPEGYFMAESSLDKTFVEIFGSELKVGESYVFWTLPAMYGEVDGEEASFYAVQDMIRSQVISPMIVTVDVTEPALLDAKVKVQVEGADAVYAGTAEVSSTYFDEIIYQVNNKIIDPVEGDLKYDGPVSTFPTKENAATINPDTEYAVWVIPAKDTKDTYSVDDIVYKTFKTKALADGGTLTLKVDEPELTSSSISVPLSGEGAAMICYAYLSNEDGNRYSTASNETRMRKLMEAQSYTSVRASATDAVIEALQPGLTKWLYAVAVGNDGLYGEVKCLPFTTEAVSFNDLKLSVSEVKISDLEATLNVAVSGGTAEDFIYWVGFEKDPFWVGVDFCNKSEETASGYMAANPTSTYITKVMNKNGAISENGDITLVELSQATNYIFLVLAKDSAGKYSKAGIHKFTTQGVNLGDDFVASTSNTWKTTKQWIEDNITWHKDSFQPASGNGQGFAAYSFDIMIPTELTAYISCSLPMSTELTDIIVEQVEYCSSSRDVSVAHEEPEGLIWVDDRGKQHNAALFFNVYDTYVHGAPDYGYVTYLAAGKHDESTCPSWESGECSQYTAALTKMANKLSLDYWKEWIDDNCNYAHNGDPNNEYSYSFTDEAKIDALAQAFVDAYKPYYSDRKPILYVNEGESIKMLNRTAAGLDQNGNVIDKVTIVLKDQKGNYYEPMYIEVPNYFR